MASKVTLPRMETLFSFPSGKSRQIVRNVQRDTQFWPQLYFLSTEQGEKPGSLLVSFEQAIWDAKTNQICCRLVSRMNVPSTTLHCAVDEQANFIYLYIVYRTGKQIQLHRFRFKYEKPDKLGYRQLISVDASKTHIFSKNEDPRQYFPVIINICPSTAKPMLHCQISGDNNLPVGFLNLELEKSPNLRWNTVSLNRLQSLEMETRSQVFSRSNDLITLISYHTRNLPETDEDEEQRNEERKVLPKGYMILHSSDPKMRTINTLKINPSWLLRNFLPKPLLDGLKANAPGRMPDFVFFGAHLQLLGEVHKYVVFFFHHHYLLAAKWPKNWYKLPQVPKVQQSIVMHVDLQKKFGDINDVWLLSTVLYQKFELQGTETIRRISFDRVFKDYRSCAFCGKQEEGKKKNKQGKRMSSFKVCRLCKKLNLHKQYMNMNASPKCHYCSFECVRKHWKIHNKSVHSGNGK